MNPLTALLFGLRARTMAGKAFEVKILGIDALSLFRKVQFRRHFELSCTE